MSGAKPVLEARPFTEEHAKALCTWRYPGPYAAYDFPDWERVRAQNWAVAVQEKREREFCAVYEGRRYVGFFRLMPDGRVSLGLAPDYCGGGRGRALMELIKTRCTRRPLRLEVRTFNDRARHCYEHAGFRVVGIVTRDSGMGPCEMYEMELL